MVPAMTRRSLKTSTNTTRCRLFLAHRPSISRLPNPPSLLAAFRASHTAPGAGRRSVVAGAHDHAHTGAVTRRVRALPGTADPQRRHIFRPDGRQVALSERVSAFHRALQRNDVEMIFRVTHPGGKQERLVMAWTLRYFFRYEVEHLLARCGFLLESVYGNFDSSPLSDTSPEMIFVAKVA